MCKPSLLTRRQPWFPDLLQSSTSLFALESALLELRQQFEVAKRTFDGESKGYVTLPRLMPPAVLERHFRDRDHTKLTLQAAEMRVSASDARVQWLRALTART